MVAVSAAVVEEGRILLVKRGREPAKGQWSLPGGVLELGETLRDGVIREVREETGLLVEPGPLLGVFENIVRDRWGEISFHYILVDYWACRVGGTTVAGSDAPEVAWVPMDRAWQYDLTPGTARVIEMAQSAGGDHE